MQPKPETVTDVAKNTSKGMIGKGDVVMVRKGLGSRPVKAGAGRGWDYAVAMQDAKPGETFPVVVYGLTEVNVHVQ